MATKLPPLELLVPAALAGGFAVGRVVIAGRTAAGSAPAASAAAADTSHAGSTATDPWATDSASIDYSAGNQSAGSLNGILPGSGSGYDSGGLPGGGDQTIPPDPGSNPPPPPPPPPPPTPSAYPSGLPAKPAGASGYVGPVYHLKRYFTVSGGVATQHLIASYDLLAWVGPSVHYKPNAYLRRILTGNHAGWYISPSDVTIHAA